MHVLRIPSDHFEIRRGGRVGLCSALLPVTQNAEWNLITGGEFLLSESQSAPQGSYSRDPAHPSEIRLPQGSRIRISGCSSVPIPSRATELLDQLIPIDSTLVHPGLQSYARFAVGGDVFRRPLLDLPPALLQLLGKFVFECATHAKPLLTFSAFAAPSAWACAAATVPPLASTLRANPPAV